MIVNEFIKDTFGLDHKSEATAFVGQLSNTHTQLEAMRKYLRSIISKAIEGNSYEHMVIKYKEVHEILTQLESLDFALYILYKLEGNAVRTEVLANDKVDIKHHSKKTLEFIEGQRKEQRNQQYTTRSVE